LRGAQIKGRESPLVSVLTPSFNQARWLPDNIRSVATQTYSRLEHIVMDGNSSDGSVGILETAMGDRLRWRSEPDTGQSAAINKAYAQAGGEIIGWLNSDDAYFSENVIEQVVSCFNSHPDAAVVYGHAALVNGDGLVLQLIWVPPFDPALLTLHNYIIQPAAFVRRSALGATLVDETYDYAMDRELWLRLAKKHAFVRLPRLLAIDRHHLDRKAYTRLDLATADQKRLIRTYGIRTGPLAQAVLKCWKVAFRLRGIGLVSHVRRERLAFNGSLDSVWILIARQLVSLRAWMPSGSR
jgi:glycosyltransferase involved in cell wall biosynthesis